ncbi:MAG TPA: formylglycine-generating enzyme family protein [Verrucomicrobiae bacterium]|nr:formylglycine-generating enzyme family protein [Verrucomicrobiae bacterium]
MKPFRKTTGVLLTALPWLLAVSGAAQTPPALEARLLAGVNITGTPGDVYVVQTTTNAANTNSWSSLAFVQMPGTNQLFVDPSGASAGQRFYRAVLVNTLTNMVFIPPATFKQGSPAGEIDRRSDEGPQTTVTLRRGYWVGKYEVTQREYLAVTGSNPSYYTNNLDRPVESVGWPTATNYCALRTAQEAAAGLIPAGSYYRLPTEAEWEHAARGGSSTRFSHGEDPSAADTGNYAWTLENSSLTTYPVGQKLPNPIGLYDMGGNVWEWCSDWYGPYSGGWAVDPQGPPTNDIGFKVIKGSSFDGSKSACRPARRWFHGSHEALTDSAIGFRVVLVTP